MKQIALLYLLALAILGGVRERQEPQAPAPYRVPDPDAGGHYKRPDGAMCKQDGDHPCKCALKCETGDDGRIVSIHMGDQCQWYCNDGKCACHPCADCDDGKKH